MRRCLGGMLLAFVPWGLVVAAEPAAAPAWLRGFTARCIGPATMSGRITDIAVDPTRPATIYVGTASGGLWKSTNQGTTWTPIFERYGSASIGDVAVSPAQPNVVWVGTGESNARNSVTWGDGVYRSSDGGKTWDHCGLRLTRHIGRIVAHPKQADVAYVAALGACWGSNPERGIFKTADGGKTWQHVLDLGPDCGCIDLVINPLEPDTLIAAAYGVRRDAFSGGNPAVMQFHPKAGLYKTTDGGKTWTKLTTGLPTCQYGRCGLDISLKNPKVLVAVVQTEKTNARQLAGQPAKASNETETGGVFRSDDGGDSWTKINDLVPRPFYFGQIRIDPNDDQRLYVLGISKFASSDGGKTFTGNAAPRVHADHHALWINPSNSEHMILGCDGGLYATYDRGQHWEHYEALPVSQFYGVSVDMRRPYWVYGGLQDNGTWGGPSATRSALGPGTKDWVRIGGGDGFHTQVDPTDWTTVYGESQYGGLFRVNMATGESKSIRPPPPTRDAPLRFNWSSPIHLSPHNPRTVYYGGNYVFRSVNRGDTWQAISPDLTRGSQVSERGSGHTISTLAESPATPGVLWVGTDDGNLHLSRDGGATWTNLTERLPGPKDRHISRVEPAVDAAGTCWVAVDRHRNHDVKPYIYRTTDFGQTWTAHVNGLPEDGSVNVVRADRVNPLLLFCGTEFGLFVTIDGGGNWHRVGAGLPTVPVHDLVIHPRDAELVIGTHGRGIWIMDIHPLQQLKPAVLTAAAHLFEPKPALAYRPRFSTGNTGARMYHASNPAYGATLAYHLRDRAEKVSITVTDAVGKVVAEFNGGTEAGMHLVNWTLRERLPTPPTRPRPAEDEGGGGEQPPPAKPSAARQTPPRRPPAAVPPGDYAVKLTVGNFTQIRKLRIDAEAGYRPETLAEGNDENN